MLSVRVKDERLGVHGVAPGRGQRVCLAGVFAAVDGPKSVRFVEKGMFRGSHRELRYRAVFLGDA